MRDVAQDGERRSNGAPYDRSGDHEKGGDGIVRKQLAEGRPKAVAHVFCNRTKLMSLATVHHEL